MANLKGRQFFTTGEINADGVVRYMQWWNDGPTIHIKSLSIGAGLICDQQADLSIEVYRNSDNSKLAAVGWDRYAHTGQPINREFNFAPDYFGISHGDGLFIGYRAYGFLNGVAHPNYTALFWVDGTYTQ